MLKTRFATLVVTGTLFCSHLSAEAAETLTYRVHYGPFTLGIVQLVSYEKGELDKDHEVIQLISKTNPTIPFISVHTKFESVIGEDGLPVRFRSLEFSDEDTVASDYEFNYLDSTLIRRQYPLSQPVDSAKCDTVRMLGPTYDGIALIHAARVGRVNDEGRHVYSFFGLKYGSVDLELTGRARELKDDVVLHERVPCHEIVGVIGFRGFVGMTGDISGWRMEDHPHTFVKAAMKIFLGSIRLQLMDAEYIPAEELVANDMKWLF